MFAIVVRTDFNISLAIVKIVEVTLTAKPVMLDGKSIVAASIMNIAKQRIMTFFMIIFRI
jgi:hypothetical protein